MSSAIEERRVHRIAKVPEITALFWLVKILTTGVGESASDFLAQSSLWIPAALSAVGLAIALVFQFRARRYQAVTYWSTVGMVAVFGTVLADVFRVGLNISLEVTTPLYAVLLAVVLGAWYRSERTLSIHSITTFRREAFYWATVLLTFALGTAAGDLTAFVVNLGFAKSAVLFALAILVPWALYRGRVLGAIPAFWIAYVLTRPLGASVADWLGKGKPLGLGYGDGHITLIGSALIVLLVGYLAVTRVDAQREAAEQA
jgi:uncharacterized membrane-anchored protein